MAIVSQSSSLIQTAPAEAALLTGKRVAMVTFSYYPDDPRPRRAAEALAEEGMKVEVICLAASRQQPRRERLNGIDILRVPLKRRRGGVSEYVFQYGAFITIAFCLLAWRSVRRAYALVHVHNMPDILVFCALVPKLLGAKVVLDLHDPMPELMMTIFDLHPEAAGVRLLRCLERWSIRLADRVLAVNIACKRLFGARSCNPAKISVVMNSPDEKVFGFRPSTPRATTVTGSKRPFRVMYHGSLVERNGLALGIEAIASLRNQVPDVELRIYGLETAFLRDVMETVDARGLGQVVRYWGPRRLEEVVAAIDDCDVGIIPNLRNVFTEINTPTRIFEYLARGKPVIAPAAAGIQDYFPPNALVFFELGDAVDLARQLEYVVAHPNLIAEVVRRGQDVYRAHAWPVERRVLVHLAGDLLRADAVTGKAA